MKRVYNIKVGEHRFEGRGEYLPIYFQSIIAQEGPEYGHCAKNEPSKYPHNHTSDLPTYQDSNPATSFCQGITVLSGTCISPTNHFPHVGCRSTLVDTSADMKTTGFFVVLSFPLTSIRWFDQHIHAFHALRTAVH